MSKVTLLQPGARHNYALASFLQSEDMLQRLYTDFAIGDGSAIGRLAGLLAPARWRARIDRRRAAGIPASKLRSRPWFLVQDQNINRSLLVSRRDLVQSDAFYLQYYAGGIALHATRPAARIISDVFICPTSYRTVNAEVAQFPEFGETIVDTEWIERIESVTHQMMLHSHVLFCPSQAVVADVEAHYPEHADKCRLVPYGASLEFGAVGAPEPGRVLFCGSIHLRKGVQYIRMAADRIRRENPHIQIVLAGGVSEQARRLLTAQNIACLGQLGREAMMEEFRRADLFLFPSLSEGSAGALLEAMAAGLPLVATRAGGVDFTDGESGFIIPERDPDAIASRVLQLVEDRALRGEMAQRARTEADQYTMSAWKTRFIQAVRDAIAN